MTDKETHDVPEVPEVRNWDDPPTAKENRQRVQERLETEQGAGPFVPDEDDEVDERADEEIAKDLEDDEKDKKEPAKKATTPAQRRNLAAEKKKNED